MKRNVQGSTLVLVLMVITLLFVIGIGLLSKKALQSGTAANSIVAAQALALAQSGVDDVLVKMAKDPEFPPRGYEQDFFSYSESVFSHDRSERIGAYTVTIDLRQLNGAARITEIECVGTVGFEDSPQARRTVSVLVDMNPVRPTYFQVVEYREKF